MEHLRENRMDCVLTTHFKYHLLQISFDSKLNSRNPTNFRENVVMILIIKMPHEMSVSLRQKKNAERRAEELIRRHIVKCINSVPRKWCLLYLYFVLDRSCSDIVQECI